VKYSLFRKHLLIGSHCVVFAGAFLTAWLLARQSLPTGTQLAALAQQRSRLMPSSVSYALGTRADAIATLRDFLRVAENPPPSDWLRQTDMDVARFRLALLTDASPEDVQRLCQQAHFACTATSLDRWIKYFRAARKVGD